MTGNAEWGQIVFIAGLIISSVTLVLLAAWFLWQRIAEVRSKCFTETNAVHKELNEFKLKVAEEYAKNQTLAEADSRTGRAIADLKRDFAERLDQRFEDMKDLLIATPAVARRMRK